MRLFAESADNKPETEELPLVVKFAIRGTPDDIEQLRGKLESLLEECNSLSSEGEDPEATESYAGLLTFYRRPDPI